MEVLCRSAHSAMCDLWCQQHQRAGVTIDCFDKICDLLWSITSVVVFWFPPFSLHHLADQFDRVVSGESAQDDFTMPMIERRGKRFTRGEDDARRGMRPKQIARKFEDFVRSPAFRRKFVSRRLDDVIRQTSA